MVKRVIEKVCISDSWPSCRTIKYWMTQFREYANTYGDDAIIFSENWGYDGHDEQYIEFERDETPEERTIRLEQARKERERKALAKLSVEEREKKEFVRLQKKYG